MSLLNKSERELLLSRAKQINCKLYPEDDSQEPSGREASKLRETYYLTLGEYADRLPRVLMSICPFTGQPFKHSFDPWGLDGYWWHESREFDIEEPAAPPTFKVLLGALSLNGRIPNESTRTVLPGPEVPFVVPRLLKLPGMVAVISKLKLETGDLAYPITYFSPEPIPPEKLHQFWLEKEFWFETKGQSAWLIANDVWDFNLEPWIREGKVRWLSPDAPTPALIDGKAGVNCPFVNLPGERLPQNISFGERDFLDLPDGSQINPYED